MPEFIYEHDWDGPGRNACCRKCLNMHPDYWTWVNSHPEWAYHDPTNPKCVVPDKP